MAERELEASDLRLELANAALQFSDLVLGTVVPKQRAERALPPGVRRSSSPLSGRAGTNPAKLNGQ
jgi:hypothetical protein